jgi:hypothetical protein
MLRTCLSAGLLALLVAGPAAAQTMPPPPSATDPLPGTKPAAKAKPAKQAKRAPADAPATSAAAKPRPAAAPLKPFDRRDIEDPKDESRFAPSIMPGGKLGMGGRF